MVRKLFWENPYQTSATTRVAAVDGARVRLAETVFFAFSGGQESDAGTVGGWPVLVAAKDGLDIVYTLSSGHDLAPGATVEVQIDWARRHRLMRLHFAAEMVLQLVYRLRPGIVRLGAHISADKARIDFAHPGSIAVLFPEIEAQVAELLRRDLPIVTGYDDVAGQRRYWAVEGFARMACGGTHPQTTGEVGGIVLKRRNQGKGTERIEILLVAPTAP